MMAPMTLEEMRHVAWELASRAVVLEREKSPKAAPVRLSAEVWLVGAEICQRLDTLAQQLKESK